MIPERRYVGRQIEFPDRYAEMIDQPEDGVLSPGHIIGGDADCGRQTENGIYIYVLIDPFTNQLRYIGKSIRPRERLANHCNEQSSCHRTHWIQSVVSRGKRPLMLILSRLPHGSEWQPVERDWIAHCRSVGWPLVNGTDGGDGVVGLSPESRERIVSAWRGRKHKPETLLKLSKSGKGKHSHSEEWRAYMRQKMSMRVFTATHRKRLSDATRKVSLDQAAEIRKRRADGERVSKLATEFGVHRMTITKVSLRQEVYANDPYTLDEI